MTRVCLANRAEFKNEERVCDERKVDARVDLCLLAGSVELESQEDGRGVEQADKTSLFSRNEYEFNCNESGLT